MLHDTQPYLTAGHQGGYSPCTVSSLSSPIHNDERQKAWPANAYPPCLAPYTGILGSAVTYCMSCSRLRTSISRRPSPASSAFASGILLRS